MNEFKEWRNVAFENGIEYSTYWGRVKRMGMSPEEAATQPLKKKKREKAKKPLAWVKDSEQKKQIIHYRKVAKENGITIGKYYQRVRYNGWDPKDAATKPVNKKELYDSNTENTQLRKANEVLRSTLKTIAMTSREQHVRDLAYRELEESR